MNKRLKIAVVASALVAMLIPDVAYGQAGRMHRATRRRTAVVVGSTVHAKDSAAANQQVSAAQQETVAAQQTAAAAQQNAAAANQEAAAAKQDAANAKQEAAAAKQQAAVPPPAGQPLPLGAIVPNLPAGCVSTAAGGQEYYHCGSNYYRAAFQGNNLVYVTAQPK